MSWLTEFRRTSDCHKPGLLRCAPADVCKTLQTAASIVELSATASSDVYRVEILRVAANHTDLRNSVSSLAHVEELTAFMRLCTADVYRVQVLKILAQAAAPRGDRWWPVDWLTAVVNSIGSDVYKAEAVHSALTAMRPSPRLPLVPNVQAVLLGVCSDVYKVSVFRQMAHLCSITDAHDVVTMLRVVGSDVYRLDVVRALLDKTHGSERMVARDNVIDEIANVFASAVYRAEASKLLRRAQAERKNKSTGGGLRLGEMERAGLLSPGFASLLWSRLAWPEREQNTHNVPNLSCSAVRSIDLDLDGDSLQGGQEQGPGQQDAFNDDAAEPATNARGNGAVTGDQGVQGLGFPSLATTIGRHALEPNAAGNVSMVMGHHASVIAESGSKRVDVPQDHVTNANGIVVPVGDHRIAPATSADGGAPSPTCHVCLDNAPNAFLEPCHHGAICVPCAKRIAAGSERRQKMTKITWIFI